MYFIFIYVTGASLSQLSFQTQKVLVFNNVFLQVCPLEIDTDLFFFIDNTLDLFPLDFKTCPE